MTNTLFLTQQLPKLLLLLFCSNRKQSLWSLVPLLQISLKKSELKTTYAQYPSGLSRALFAITFLEIAVYYFL